MKHISKISALLLVLTLIFSVFCTGALAVEDGAEILSFPSDVEEGGWYTDAVKYVFENGIMIGTGENKFSPNGVVTRGAVFQAFYNIAGRPATTGESFDDVAASDWFADAAAWAKETGMSLGTGRGFEGNKVITRAELAMAFYNYMKLNGISGPTVDLSAFVDADQVPAWAKEAVQCAVGVGIMKGKGNGILDPTGKTLRSELAQIHFNFAPLRSDATSGVVAVVEKYGNLTLSILTQNLFNAGFELGDVLTVNIGDLSIDAPFCTSYSDVDTGKVVVRGPGGVGTNKIIIAINMGDFAGTYGIQVGDTVTLEMKEPGGYLNEYELRQLKRTSNREDYESDEIFANFRGITLGGIAEGVLYRSSSPVNNEIGRAAYADNFAEAAGIVTVLNLANTDDEVLAYFAEEDFDSPYYEGLYENDGVVCLSMGVDLNSADFQAKLKTGLEFLIENEGPYLIHCNEGKDRAGFVAAVLEALMGATAEEIKVDYMVTYMNYYHVEYGSEQYERIGDKNILDSIRGIAGLESGADLTGVDLSATAENYLLGIGLTQVQIDALMARLSTPVSLLLDPAA